MRQQRGARRCGVERSPKMVQASLRRLLLVVGFRTVEGRREMKLRRAVDTLKFTRRHLLVKHVYTTDACPGYL